MLRSFGTENRCGREDAVDVEEWPCTVLGRNGLTVPDNSQPA